jgi:hypothetical protein
VYSRAGEVTVNLRKLLASVVRKKRNKYGTYIGKHALSECWLVLHNNLFEFPEFGEKGRADRRVRLIASFSILSTQIAGIRFLIGCRWCVVKPS